MQKHRPSKVVICAEVAGLLAVVGIGILEAPKANWDIALIGLIFAFTAVSDLTAVATPSRLKISGDVISLILAIVFLGATPAAIIGAGAILVGWLRWRDVPDRLLINLLTYTTFPLVGGIGFRALVQALGLTPTTVGFYLLVTCVFFALLVLNFVMIAGYVSYVERDSFWQKARNSFLPLMPSQLATAMMAIGVVYLYHAVGIAAVALFGIILATFQHLLGKLLLSEQRAEELGSRTKQLVSFQVGMLSALMRTLDLRDKMTARHSAAVARYSRAIAEKAGLSQSDQELVHIAGLLHDIGKFILPDKILKGNEPLTDEDWNLIKRHPAEGAKVVGAVEGYGPVAKIIIAHHERIDGKGYPRRLKGDEIPELARIISVACTYDVMTARDTYREPVSSFEAIQELKAVSGEQLDGRFVDIFIQVLEGKDITFRHGEDADFDAELALDERIDAVEQGVGFLVGADNGGSENGAKHAEPPRKVPANA